MGKDILYIYKTCATTQLLLKKKYICSLVITRQLQEYVKS